MMKYIRPIFENKSRNLCFELNQLSYILEDDGYDLDITPWAGNRFLILIDSPGAEDSDSFKYVIMQKLQETDSFKEYLDRVREVCAYYKSTCAVYLNFAKQFSQRLKSDILIIQIMSPFETGINKYPY